MKKNVLILSALCLATLSLIFSGCKKENNDPQEPAKVQTYKMSIQASKGADQQANGPRRVLSLDGTTLNATWQAGEKVSVRNVTKGADLTGYLEAQTSGANVQLEGTLTGTIEVGDKLTLKYLSADYTGQNGTLAYISANCDYAVAEDVEVVSVDGSTIYTTGTADFVNQQAIVKFTLKDAADHTTPLSPTALTFNDGTADIATLTIPDATYTTNGAGVLYVAVPGFSGKNITLTATVGSDTYAFEKANTTLTNGQYYILTVEMTKQAPAYKEYGPFSVSPTQKVNFSQGNLKYTKSTGKFEFMTNQYDMVETNNQNVGNDYASQDVISLFGWATSNLNTPVANTYYQPWNTDNAWDCNAKYGSGITTDNVSWAAAHANYDWGANTGDLGTGWRTLTKDEWVYLFNTRTVNGGTGNGKSYTYGQSVNGTPGVVLYPDNYTGATYTTGSNWSTFENKGCVFLPAAGFRDGTNVSNVGLNGFFWSSTYGSSTGAYGVCFNGSSVNPAYAYSRFRGCSVRLIKNVE